MDLDLDDLGFEEASIQAAPRPSRFLPKSAKLKPKPKLDTKPKLEPSIDVPVEPVLETKLEEPVKKPEEEKPEVEVELKDNDPMEVQELIEDPMQEDKLEEATEEEEEEDIVVREIDVYFTPPVDNNTQLIVMQYPLRPCWRPYELDQRCKEVRVKPKSLNVEVDLSLDLEKNYDADVVDKSRIEKHTLSSSWKPAVTTGYAVGVLKGNKLNLNPVNAVVQLRPSLEHLNASRLKKNTTVTSKASSSNNTGVGETVSVSAEEDESWVPLDYHGTDSNFSTAYRQKMTSQETSAIQFSMGPSAYLNSLCPGCSTDTDKGLSKKILLSLPLEDRIKKWLSLGPQTNRFCLLKHLAPDHIEEDLLEVLQRHAFLVQGLWVSRTTLFQLNGNESLARDFILLLFKKSEAISLEELQKHNKLFGLLKHYANQFGIYRPSFHDWKFKEPKDKSMTGYPDVVQQQEKEWENLEMKLMKVLQKPKMENSSKPTINNKPRTAGDADISAKTRMNRTSGSSTVTVSDEAREAMVKVLEEILRKHNVCSLKLICEDLRENALFKSSFLTADARGAVAIAREADIYLPELQAVLSQVAINIHGVYALKSLGDPNLDPLRKVVIDLFCAEPPKAKLKKAVMIAAAKKSFEERDIKFVEKEQTQVLNQVLNQLCVSAKSAWVLRSGDGNPA